MTKMGWGGLFSEAEVGDVRLSCCFQSLHVESQRAEAFSEFISSFQKTYFTFFIVFKCQQENSGKKINPIDAWVMEKHSDTVFPLQIKMITSYVSTGKCLGMVMLKGMHSLIGTV